MADATNLIIFLPWLHLAQPATIAGIEWIPWKSGRGVVNPRLLGFESHLATIFSGYVDIQGDGIRNCTVACAPDGGPNLTEELFDGARWSSSLLFLACWASNSYFQQIDFSYVNSSLFRLVGQRFSNEPIHIALGSRRRDGQTLDGGYAHGEVRFTAPLQCRLGETAKIDQDCLTALDRAETASSPTLV